MAYFFDLGGRWGEFGVERVATRPDANMVTLALPHPIERSAGNNTSGRGQPLTHIPTKAPREPCRREAKPQPTTKEQRGPCNHPPCPNTRHRPPAKQAYESPYPVYNTCREQPREGSTKTVQPQAEDDTPRFQSATAKHPTRDEREQDNADHSVLNNI